MSDFFELERKCKQLKRKKLIKYSSIFLLFIILIGVAIYFITKPQPLKSLHTTKITPKPQPTNPTKPTKPKVIVKIKEKNITKVVVKKVKVFIEKNITKPTPPAPTLSLDINLTKIQKIDNPKQKAKAELKTKKTNTQPIKKQTSILQNETITFNKALTLAKKYYENADYENSIKWCKLASKIDNNDERVWKLYALNLEKTGQKEKAIKLLKTYLKYKNSLELKYLLQRFENEKN